MPRSHSTAHPVSPQGLKRRVFTALTLCIPVVFLVALESALRIFHYGPDISLFTPISVGGRSYLAVNPDVGKRYFPGTEFTPATSPDAFLKEKPAGTYRIFCLGGSTTVGYPYWFNAAFSTFLRDRLHAIFPDRSIDVINLGLTATNSFTVLDIARDLAEAEPDLVLVYDGHNEFYGALGVASRESPTGARWLTEMSLRLLRFRTFLLLRDLYGKIGAVISSHPADDRGTMMERLARGENIPLGGRLYGEALAAFRENLHETVTLFASRGIPVIFGTQVSNLRTLHPFVSPPRPELSPAAARDFRTSYDAGLDALARGAGGRGIPFFRRALLIDSTRADAVFALAQSLESVGEVDAARREYRRARDLDQLRFRASSEFNRAIAALADGHRTGAVDMEAVFAAGSADSIVGNELIFEHLHPRARGYFLMAKAYAEEMKRMGLIVPQETWRARDTVRDERLWDERPITPLDERIASRKIEILTSGWPFRNGPPTVSGVPAADTLGQIVEQVTRSRVTWEQAHEEALSYYRARGDWISVEREYRTIISQTPLDIQPRLSFAHFLMERGRLEEMGPELRATLSVQPTKLAYRALGDLALDAGKPVDAILLYTKLEGFPQEREEMLENGYLLGLAFAQAGAPDSAAAHMERLLTLKPGYAPAAELLKRLRGMK